MLARTNVAYVGRCFSPGEQPDGWLPQTGLRGVVCAGWADPYDPDGKLFRIV